MQIIPVIDLSKGRVVHAVAGKRERYRPVRSQLCPGSDPGHIVQAFLDLYPFATLYIADLDAIAGLQADGTTIRKLLVQFPRLHIWLDQGLRDVNGLPQAEYRRVTHVVGSETNIGPQRLAAFVAMHPQPVLSLDFRGEQFLGDPALLQCPDLWPERVIYMNLARVGTGSSVDEQRLLQIRSAGGQRQIYCAGGIRNLSDLYRLQDHGVNGVLLASALHNGGITASELKLLEEAPAKKMPR